MSDPHDYPSVFAALFRAVLQASWQGSLAIALVLLVRRVLGTRVPARWHHLLWFLVLARLLVPTVALPHSPASLENIPALANPFEPPPSVLQPDTLAVDPGLFPPVPTAPARSSVDGPTPGANARSVSPGKTWSPWIWAAWIWLVGVVLLAGWLAACVVRLRGRLRHETTPAEESILTVWRACCQRWLRQTPPPLRVADWVDSPALVGWWRPTLLIPRQSLATFSAQDWEHVFAHEIAHLRWRDHWTQLLLLASWCVHWFNPVVWIGFRRLRADRELAADEWVLRRLEDERALAYGETLFKTLANRPARLAFQPGMVGISEDSSQIKQRLRRIVAFLPHRRLQGSLAGCAALLLLGTVVLGQSTPHAANPPGTAAQPSPATSAASAVSSPDAAVQQLADAILAAARAGDRRKVTELLHPTAPYAPHLGKSNVAQILDDLLRRREFPAFTVLFDASQRSILAKDWQTSDTLLAGLVKDGRTDFLDVLLVGGLDPVRLGEQAKSADQPTTEWITRRVAEETRRRTDIEALESAAAHGDLPAMSRLVDAGADVNGVGKDHNTPLLRAVFSNRLDAAQWLLDHGAQVDKPRYPGWNYTPLCVVNSVPMAELLKKYGANVHAKLYSGEASILTYVVSFAPSDVVEWFLRQGLDPKMRGDGREPNLLFELKDGRTANLLLDAGVDPNQIDEDGRTPLSKARSGEVAQALIEHGAKVTGLSKPLLPDLVQFGSAGAVEAVLKAGGDQDDATLQGALADVDRMDIRDYPEKDAMRRVLIEHGAKPVPAQPTPRPSISCRATVSVADGAFVDFSTVEVYHSESYGPDGGGGRTWGGSGTADADGSINLNIQQGATSASYVAVKEGYATVYAGPFTPPTKEKVDGIHFVLTKGFAAAIVTVDEAGQPIAGARLESYYPDLPTTKLANTTTDAAGSTTIEHIGEAPVNVRVLADGFQADEVTGIHLDPAKPYRWTLKKAQPRPGIVTDASTGKPIPGAVIKLAGVRGPHNETSYDPKKAPVLTAADAQGRFTLGSLRPDSRYYLFVEAPGHSGAFLRGVRLTPDELSVVLGPELFIRGKITHAPPWIVHMDKVYLNYGQAFEFEDNSSGMATATAYLRPVNGEADFSVGPFYKVSGEPIDPKGTATPKKPHAEIYVDSWAHAEFNIDTLPISDFVFDLAQKTNDRSAPEPDAPAKQATTEGEATPKGEPSSTAAPLPPPPEAPSTVPPPAPKAEIIEITATASTEDGAPIGYHSAEIHPSLTFGPNGARGYQVFPSFNEEGTSLGTSLMRFPSDAQNLVIAVTKEGYAVAFVGPWSPPLEEKLKGLHFTLTKGFAAKVQIVDETGQPIAGARLKSRYSKPLYLDLAETVTGVDGDAAFAHLGAVPLDLLVRADGYEADEADGVQLDPAKPYRWTLKKATPLSGTVTAATSGQLIPGAKIKLAAVRGPYNETYADAPHAPLLATADFQGRFTLTSLRTDSRYFLFVEAPNHGGVLLRDIQIGQPELKIALGPELFVHGRFLHIPAASINAYDGTFNFGYDQFFDIADRSWAVAQQGRVTPKNGEADFTIDALYDNSVLIIAEGKETKLEAKDLPKSGLVIDLTREPISSNPSPSPSGVVTTLGIGSPGNQ